MARIRAIKPALYSSLKVSRWPVPVRWTFVGLFTYMDDAGRGVDEPRLVKAELYPLDDVMTPKRVNEHMAVISSDGPLCRYEVDGNAYCHLTAWHEHQRINRPTPSRIPPCPTHEQNGAES